MAGLWVGKEQALLAGDARAKGRKRLQATKHARFIFL